MGNRDKFLKLVSKENHNKTAQLNKWRIENRESLRESGRIAFEILEKLDELEWSVEDLSKSTEIPLDELKMFLTGSQLINENIKGKIFNSLGLS